MKVSRSLTTSIAIASLVSAMLLTSPVSANPDYENVGMQGQSEIDNPQDPANNAGWPQATEGLAGRPFVVDASVDGTDILTNTPTAPGTETWNGNWRVVIAPANVCRTGQTSNCYASPNRVSLTVTYEVNGNNLYNFGGSSLSARNVTPNSEFDISVDLNAFENTLGWTWLNGQPTYWNVTDGIVHVKFKPGSGPSTQGIDNGCSRIPVEGCSTTQSVAELLTANFVMSFDTTLNPVFDHTLFASEGAVIASLQVGSGFSLSTPTTNTLTYGVASTHLTTSGDSRRGNFYAVLPNSTLTSAFGLTDMTQIATLMQVKRVTDTVGVTGTDAVTWTPWVSADQGVDGQLLKISDISFSAPKFQVNRVGGAPKPFSVKKGKTVFIGKVFQHLKLSAPTSSQKFSVTVASTSKSICTYVSKTKVIKGLKKGTCKLTIKVLTKKGKLVKSKTGSFAVTS